MLPKEIMLRTGTRTKANASDVGASPPCASSVTFAKKLLNPGSLSLLLKVLAHLADCPRSRIPGAARGPSLSTAARGSPVASRTLLVAAYGSSRATHQEAARETHQEAARWTEGSGRLLPDAEV